MVSERPRLGRGNTLTRRVAVVMSDSYQTLQLVEVTTQVKRGVPTEKQLTYRVDKNAVEELARQRLRDSGKDDKGYDFVGVLVAHDDALARGRITWAEEVETVEAVTL